MNFPSRATAKRAALLLLFVVLACFQARAQSQQATTPHTTDGHPDLGGLWGAGGDLSDNVGHQKIVDGKKVQYLQRNGNDAVPGDTDLTKARALNQVAGQERREQSYKDNPDLAPSYKPEFQAKVHDLDVHENEVDPAFHCHPAGVPRMGPPREIVQAPGVVVLLYMSENGAPYRVIPTDGRKHRTDVEPSYSGDSVGHWEGDTLVVDVNRFNDDTWLGEDGWFHTTQMHVVERFTRVGDMLKYQVMVEDPGALSKPWVKKPVSLKLDDPSNIISDPTSIEAPCIEVDSAHIVNHDHL